MLYRILIVFWRHIMNYDAIIVELLGRIQKLEKDVKSLQQEINSGFHSYSPESHPKTTTKDIRTYIEDQKAMAKENGQTELVLKANDIHKSLQLRSRFPMVCNAMRQCMRDGDVVLHDTASGYSSTLEIRYYLSNEE